VDKAKPFPIPKREVWEAFKRVKANQRAAGVDGQSIAEFEANLSGNLYKLWNRLSSGSYSPRSGPRTFAFALSRPGRLRSAPLRTSRYSMSFCIKPSRKPRPCLVSVMDVAIATAFLAHEASRLITGDTLYVDGGYHVID